MHFRLRKMIRKLRVIWFSFKNRNNEFKEYTPAQKNLFDEIRPGDIIDCWMPLKPHQLKAVPEDHMHRPYYAVKKLEHSLLCFYGTSQYDEKKAYARVRVSRDLYNVWKDGYLCTDRMYEIPINCLINKLDSLHEGTMIEANRRMTVLQHRGGYTGPLFSVPVTIRKGDIIRYRKAYYYVHAAGNTIEAYALNTGCHFNDSLCLDRTNMDLSNPKIFFSTEGMKLFWICNPKQMAYAEFYISSTPQPCTKTGEIQTLKEGHYYRYDVGQFFARKWEDERILYLFSRNDRDYGIREEDILSGSLNVRRFSTEWMEERGYADDDIMTYTLNKLISTNNAEWGWLDELMCAA